MDSTNADAEVNLGNAIVRQGQPGDAIAHYVRAASIRPDHPETHLNWGVALAQVGKWGDAIEQFRRVLALRPDHAEAREYLDRAEEMRSSTPPARRD